MCIPVIQHLEVNSQECEADLASIASASHQGLPNKTPFQPKEHVAQGMSKSSSLLRHEWSDAITVRLGLLS